MQRDILPIIKNSNENLLILGKAGVGKSTLIKIVKKHFGKKCVILCPTGIAAQNVNGLTIHSFFNLPIVHSIEKKHIEKSSNILKSIDKFKRLQEIETIIIDEISMVNAMIFDAIDLILKTVYQTTKPFGGKRVILIGDIFQLPPIDKQNSRGDRIFFWNSTAFRQSSYVCTELRKVYRLKDTLENREFERILEKIRVYKTTQPDLDFLNSKYKQNQSINETTVLCSRKDDAKQYNYQGLQGLGKRVYNFKAEYSKEFPENEFPVDMELDLAIGAPVIFIRNDVSSTYKNGTRGKVKAINAEEKKITVRLENNQEVSVGYVEWLPSKYNDLDLAQRAKIKDYFRHFPLILGYAMTIHRCQGMTMSNVHLDLGRGAFAAGQLYVALSRLREINGLTLEKKLQRSDLIQSSETLRFYNNTNFEEVNLNLTGAELSTVDSKNELIKTTQGFQLETKSLSVHLFNQGLNVDEIHQERIRLGFKEILPKTIISHLIERYEEVDIKELKDLLFITDDLEQEICEELSEINDVNNYSLTEIRNSLSNPELDWDKLRFILYINGFLSPPAPSRNRMISSTEIPTVEPVRQIDRNLFEILRALRLEKANERSIKPFQIFHDSSLEEMATIKPITRSEFLNIYRVGQFKLEEFGDVFIETIRGHCGVESEVSHNYSQLDSQLFEELKKLRNTLARERTLPAYCIFNNDTLKEMATVKPITKTQFLSIGGVGEVKMNEFGDSFISCIKENA